MQNIIRFDLPHRGRHERGPGPAHSSRYATWRFAARFALGCAAVPGALADLTRKNRALRWLEPAARDAHTPAEQADLGAALGPVLWECCGRTSDALGCLGTAARLGSGISSVRGGARNATEGREEDREQYIQTLCAFRTSSPQP